MAELEVQPWMHAPNGFLHAASVILLADTCAGYATIAHLPEGAKNFTTIELKSNFLGTAKEGVIRCEDGGRAPGPHDAGAGRRRCSAAQGKKMALFRCTQMILEPDTRRKKSPPALREVGCVKSSNKGRRWDGCLVSHPVLLIFFECGCCGP